MTNLSSISGALRPVPVTLAILTAIAAGWLIGTNPVVGVVLVIGGLAGLSIVANPMLGIYAIISSLVVGQFVRLPAFGGAGAVLPNDILIPAIAIGWLLAGLLRQRVEFVTSPLSWPLASMLVVFVLTFILGVYQLPFLTDRQIVASALYIVRWLEYVMLFFVVADLVRSEKRGRRVMWWLISAAAALAILGFFQLKLFPDFRFMVPQGWDPHIGRLLSTWFDPNFLGGFFALVTAAVLGLAIFARGRERIALWVCAAVLFAALVLTFSRSSYAALLVVGVILTLLRSRRMFLLLVVVLGIVVLTVPRVQERVLGALSIDETARLRLVSWQNALTVVRDHPVTGIGYNTYRFVQVDYGFLKDSTEHSAGGSDSSLLTILVTTGPLGVLTYLWIVWSSLSIAWSSYRSKTASAFTKGLGLGALAGLVGLLVHSVFINSLLFPHMMEVLAVMFGILVGLGTKPARQLNVV